MKELKVQYEYSKPTRWRINHSVNMSSDNLISIAFTHNIPFIFNWICQNIELYLYCSSSYFFVVVFVVSSIAYVDFGRHIASISYKLLRMAIISHTSTIVSCLIPLVWLGVIIFLHVQMYLLTNCVQCVWDDKLSFYNRSICVPYRNQWDKAHWHSNRVLNIGQWSLE